MRRHRVLLLLALFLSSTIAASINSPRFRNLIVKDERLSSTNLFTSSYPYSNLTKHEGDIVVDDAETFLIQNCEFIQRGNIVVKDIAKLIINDAILNFNLTNSYQYNITTGDSAELLINAGTISSINYQYPGCELYMTQRANATLNGAYINARIWSYDNSLITGNKVTLTNGLQSYNNSASLFENSVFYYGGPLFVTDNSRLSINKSSTGPVLCADYASITLEDAHSAIELMFNGNSNASLSSLSTFNQYWNIYENATVAGIHWNITLKKTFVNGWILYLYDSASVTVLGCEQLDVHCFGASKLALEKVGLFENEFRDISSGIITHSQFWYSPLVLTGNSSVSVLDTEMGWISAFDNAFVTIKNSIINPGIISDTWYDLTDYVSAVFENVTIDSAYFYKYSSGVIKSCHEIGAIGVLENATVLFQNSSLFRTLTMWGHSNITIHNSTIHVLHAQDFAVIFSLGSTLDVREIYGNATLCFDYRLTLDVELNDLALENATVKVLYERNQSKVAMGTTDLKGQVNFILLGEVVHSSRTETLTYKIETRYYNLTNEKSVGLTGNTNALIQLFDHNPPSISILGWHPTGPSPMEDVTVNVTTNDRETYVNNSTLCFKIEDNWRTVEMIFKEGFWSAIIPKQPNGTTVEFYIKAYDASGNIAETETHKYTVIETSEPKEPEPKATEPEQPAPKEPENGPKTDLIPILLILLSAIIIAAIYLIKFRKRS